MRRLGLAIILISCIGAQTAAAQSCGGPMLVEAQITEQSCPFWRAECVTTFTITPNQSPCLKQAVTIKERHFKDNYPDGLVGGFRFDGDKGDIWLMQIAPQDGTWVWSYYAPGQKSADLVQKAP